MLPSIKFIKDWKICIKLSCIKVIKFINSRNPKDKQKIKEKFELLQNKNGFRLRINNYRFIYDVLENELIIYMEDADNKGDIY